MWVGLAVVVLSGPLNGLKAAEEEIQWDKLTPEEAREKWQSKKSKWTIRREKEQAAAREKKLRDEKRKTQAQHGTRERTKRFQGLNALFEKDGKKKEKEKEEQKKKLAKQRKECLKLKNKLKDFEEYRTRWYKLDEEGNRVYLSQDEIDQDHRALGERIQRRCSTVNS